MVRKSHKINDFIKFIFVLLVSFNSIVTIGSSSTYELRVLSWEGYTPNHQIEQFKEIISEKYDIKLKMTNQYVSSSDDFFDKIRRNEADIIFPSHNTLNDPRYKLLSRKMIIPINIDNVKNYSNLSHDILKNITHINRNNIYFVPMIYGPYGLIYNTDFFSTAPDT